MRTSQIKESSRSCQICNLEEQLEQFKEELENKSEEVQQLHMQLEIQRKEIISQQDYLETRDSLLQVLGRRQVHKNLDVSEQSLSRIVSLRLSCAIFKFSFCKDYVVHR